jgi:hypothetical protein
MMAGMLNDSAPMPGNFSEWARQPEFIFFMSIAMPCWLEYHTTPWKLYRRAPQCMGAARGWLWLARSGVARR